MDRTASPHNRSKIALLKADRISNAFQQELFTFLWYLLHCTPLCSPCTLSFRIIHAKSEPGDDHATSPRKPFKVLKAVLPIWLITFAAWIAVLMDPWSFDSSFLIHTRQSVNYLEYLNKDFAASKRNGCKKSTPGWTDLKNKAASTSLIGKIQYGRTNPSSEFSDSNNDRPLNIWTRGCLSHRFAYAIFSFVRWHPLHAILVTFPRWGKHIFGLRNICVYEAFVLCTRYLWPSSQMAVNPICPVEIRFTKHSPYFREENAEVGHVDNSAEKYSS